MNLKEFLEQQYEDDNLFWRLSSGDYQNLLDEALEKIEELEKQLGGWAEGQLETDCSTAGWVEQASVKLIENEDGKFWEVHDHDNRYVEFEKELILHVDKWPLGAHFNVYIPVGKGEQ